nr:MULTISPECIES: transposase domain-containing protein [unclassified Rhizobacter]
MAVNTEFAARQERVVAFKQTVIDKLTHEMAVLKRLKFAATSERFSSEQKSLLEEAIDEDLEALAREVERHASPAKDDAEKRQPKRQALPANLPRREIHHEPETTTCSCGCALKRIGEDVAEKLDYEPGTFTVERHVRGKWACAHCRTLIQAPVPAHVIDKGLATALTRLIDDADLSIDNNRVENLIRPIALGRKNWLFAGSLRAGQRAAAIMSLLHTAKLNGHDPYLYLKDVLERLPTQADNRIRELLPYCWQP